MDIELLSSVASISALVASVVPLVVKYITLRKGIKEIATLELKVEGNDETITIDTSDLSLEKVERLLEALHMETDTDSGGVPTGQVRGASK